MNSAKILLKSLVLCAIAALAAFIYFYHIPHTKDIKSSEPSFLFIKKGDSVDKIASNLLDMGAINSKANFTFFVRLLRRDNLLKVGRYEIKPGSSLAQIIGKIVRGEATPFNITIPEGFTMAQISNLLESTAEINVQDFRDIVTSRVYLDSLKIEGRTLEGYLAPSTYNLYYGESAKRVVHRMVSHFFESLPDSFDIKASRLNLTRHQAITLASLIEKEAMIDGERPIIAAVYLNRLRKGMRLECDPTVIYALGGGLGRPLLRADLTYDSPYNTYLYFGLPPGPIANPGVKSLEAAVNPGPVGYLYFVANGNGSHTFSFSLDDHNTATARIKRQNGRR